MVNELLQFLSKLKSKSREVLPDILLFDLTIVNACAVGTDEEWVMVDAGLSNSETFILETTLKRFGRRPTAIVLTHGHFDHVGSLERLAEYWDVPIYAHPLEMPYLSGKKDYPSADASSDEGLVAKMSPWFPHTAINLGFRLAPLPEDGSVPGMKGWRWIHTPGHTEGHISLFRESDRTLIAGDAFTTIMQESLLSVLARREKIKGPPVYMTLDWEKARNSVAQLRGLNPALVIPSHGKPMSGRELEDHLTYLAEHFEEVAVPRRETGEDRPEM